VKQFENELNEIEIKHEQAIKINIVTPENNNNNSSNAAANGNSSSGEYIKSRLNQIKAGYKQLTGLSGMYSKSFKHVDTLVQLVDEFSSNLARFERSLDSPPVLEINNIAQMKTEMDVVSVS
jgi:hypothetical protein